MGGPIDALLLGQAGDPRVGPVVQRCTTDRLAFVARAYRDLGLSPQRAMARARLVYGAYIGVAHLTRVPGGAPVTPREARVFARELELLLSV